MMVINDPDVLISGLDETFAVDLTEVHENVLKDGQVITFDAIADKQYGDVFDLNAVSTSGLSISYEIVDGPATILGSYSDHHRCRDGESSCQSVRRQ